MKEIYDTGYFCIYDTGYLHTSKVGIISKSPDSSVRKKAITKLLLCS